MFNTYARLRDGLPMYRLGVPGPSNAYDGSGNNANKPTIVSITGGAAPVLTRSLPLHLGQRVRRGDRSPSLPVDRLRQCQRRLEHRQHHRPAGGPRGYAAVLEGEASLPHGHRGQRPDDVLLRQRRGAGDHDLCRQRRGDDRRGDRQQPDAGDRPAGQCRRRR